jgi:hypothetical protein
VGWIYLAQNKGKQRAVVHSVAIKCIFLLDKEGRSLHKTGSGPWNWFASERSAGATGDGTTWAGSVTRNTH